MSSQERLDDIAEALKRAESAIEKIKRGLQEGGLADVSGEALREVEDLVARSETLSEAEAKLRGAVLRRPLTTLALAFGAGLALALLTRG